MAAAGVGACGGPASLDTSAPADEVGCAHATNGLGPWRKGPDLPTPLRDFGIAAVGRDVLVFGG
jgi:hypothetical protein